MTPECCIFLVTPDAVQSIIDNQIQHGRSDVSQIALQVCFTCSEVTALPEFISFMTSAI